MDDVVESSEHHLFYPCLSTKSAVTVLQSLIQLSMNPDQYPYLIPVDSILTSINLEMSSFVTGMRVDAACANCGEVNTNFLCGGCKLVRYCSKGCQVADWKKNHKKLCAQDLFKIAFDGNVSKMSDALLAGANANAKTKKPGIGGITLLIIASGLGHVEVVKLLLENGADVNTNNDIGISALMAASSKGFVKVVKLLLEKGADVNAKNDDNLTALIIASQTGHTEVAELLLEKGADVNAKNNDGYTALMAASLEGHPEVVKLLSK